METTRGEKIAAFKAACEHGIDAGAGHILIRSLPAGDHETKRNALPDFISDVVASFDGAVFQSPQSISTMLNSIPKSKDGRENTAVAAIIKASKFLGCDL